MSRLLGKARIVYLDTGRMLLCPPGTISYHRGDRKSPRDEWPRYIDDPEASARVGYAAAMVHPEHDRERHFTACGMTTYDSRSSRKIVLNGVRLDNARLVARPCRKCFPG